MKVITGLPASYTTWSSCQLVELERRVTTGPGTYTSTFYRYTDWTSQITYNGAAGFDRPAVGAVFTKLSFTAPNIIHQINAGPVGEIAFDDHQDIIKSLAINFDFLDWKVRVWEMGVNPDGTMAWITLRMSGVTYGVDWDEPESDSRTTIGVRADTSGEQVLGPREAFAAICRFRFKSARCGYVGAETVCNRSFTRCTELLNQVRFGGMRRAPNAEQTVFWGTQATILKVRPLVLNISGRYA